MMAHLARDAHASLEVPAENDVTGRRVSAKFLCNLEDDRILQERTVEFGERRVRVDAV